MPEMHLPPMPQDDEPQAPRVPVPQPPQPKSWSDNIVIKALIVGFLALILLIPATLVTGIIDERQEHRDEAITEIGSKWGGKQDMVP